MFLIVSLILIFNFIVVAERKILQNTTEIVLSTTVKIILKVMQHFKPLN